MSSVNMDGDLLCTRCGSSLKFAAARGDGWRCPTCGALTPGLCSADGPADAAAPASDEASYSTRWTWRSVGGVTFLLAAVVVFGAFLVNEVAWASGRESVEYSEAQLLLSFALWWAILYALGRIVRRGYGWLRRAR